MEFQSGVYTVIPTFFKDSEVDIGQLVNAVQQQINCGIQNIVLLFHILLALEKPYHKTKVI